MVLRFLILVLTFFFASCSDIERNNPDDPNGLYYQGNQNISPALSSSSNAVYPPQSSSSSFSPQPVSSSSAKSSNSNIAQSSSAMLSSSSRTSSSSNLIQSGVVYGDTVIYQGETYETVVIGTQTWFKRNLNYDVEASKCYNNDPSNCKTYGRLYDWATAMALPSNCNSTSCSGQVQPKQKGICPSGWHIPSDTEWGALMQFVNPSCPLTGDCPNAGKLLKATNGWNSNGNGTDAFGFTALPGGHGNTAGLFNYVGIHALWFSSNEYNSTKANTPQIDYDKDVVIGTNVGKKDFFSVRCVKDD